VFFKKGWLGLHGQDSLFMDAKGAIPTGNNLLPVEFLRGLSGIPPPLHERPPLLKGVGGISPAPL